MATELHLIICEKAQPKEAKSGAEYYLTLCEKCRDPLWISLSNQTKKLVHPEYKVVDAECAAELMLERTPPPENS